MRILVLNADYWSFLRSLYADTPALAEATYAEQMRARNASLFGVAGFYSQNLRAHGHEAAEIHVNNPWLQRAWAQEHGLAAVATLPSSQVRPRTAWVSWAIRMAKPGLLPIVNLFRPEKMTIAERSIVAAQIEDFRPDVVLNHDMDFVGNSFLKRVCSRNCLIVGQLAAPLPAKRNFDAYDLVISSLPNLVTWFRTQGVRTELNRLAFEPSVLEALGPAPERDIDLSFVGSLSPEHGARIALLEHVARHTQLKVWGNGIERLPKSSPLHARYQGEAWGRSMYEVLRRSRITLNHHIDLAGPWANNMRLYEATGAGAMLLTDAKKNLHEIFAPGEQVATYSSAEECVLQVSRYLGDERSRSAIAAGGQYQAIHVQNYYNRMAEFLTLIFGVSPGRARAG